LLHLDDLQTTVDTKTNIEQDSPGFLSCVGLGVTENKTLQTQISQSSSAQNSTSKTFSQEFIFNGNGEDDNYACEVYFDVVFGVFAFRDVTPMIKTTNLTGMAKDNSGKIIPNSIVIVKSENKQYQTLTNSKGQFKFFLSNLDPGHLQVSNNITKMNIEFQGKPIKNMELRPVN
jgi:mannose/fructose/N-acetylgalactosamine-specific phosphotransferase system component IIB